MRPAPPRPLRIVLIKDCYHVGAWLNREPARYVLLGTHPAVSGGCRSILLDHRGKTEMIFGSRLIVAACSCEYFRRPMMRLLCTVAVAMLLLAADHAHGVPRGGQGHCQAGDDCDAVRLNDA